MISDIPTYVVVPSEGRECLYKCLDSVRDQSDLTVLVVNNGYEGKDVGPPFGLVQDTDPDPNISRWWNIGLDAVEMLARNKQLDRWNTVVLNDDVIMGPGSVDVLTSGLRRHEGAQLAFCGPVEKLLTEPGPDRITGWCFAVRGEGGLRADESLKWWAGDNALDWEARRSGGTVIVPGVEHEHLYPNGYTVSNPKLNEQAGRDMALFIRKWGRAAW